MALRILESEIPPEVREGPEVQDALNRLWRLVLLGEEKS